MEKFKMSGIAKVAGGFALIFVPQLIVKAYIFRDADDTWNEALLSQAKNMAQIYLLAAAVVAPATVGVYLMAKGVEESFR